MEKIEAYAGRSHDEAYATRKGRRVAAQEQPGGDMAVEGTQADATHSCGELSERGKRAWQTGSGIDGGGLDNGGRDIAATPDRIEQQQVRVKDR